MFKSEKKVSTAKNIFNELANQLSNFDLEKFEKSLQEAIELHQFDIDLIPEYIERLKSSHIRENIVLSKQLTLLHLAIDAKNYVAASILIEHGANAFIPRNIKKKRGLFGKNTTELNHEKIDTRTVLDQLNEQSKGFFHIDSEIDELIQLIVVQALSFFEKEGYHSGIFDDIAKYNLWQKEQLEQIYLTNEASRADIENYLEKTKRVDQKNEIIIRSILPIYSKNLTDREHIKKFLLLDLEKTTPDLKLEHFKTLCDAGFFYEDELDKLLVFYSEKIKSLHYTDPEYGYEILEETAINSNPYYAAIKYFFDQLHQEYETYCYDEREGGDSEKEELDPMEQERKFYEGSDDELMEPNDLDPMEQERKFYEGSDDELMESNDLDEESVLDSLIEEIPMLAKELKTYWPEDEYRFTILSLEFQLTFEELEKAFEKYDEYLNKVKRSNSNYYGKDGLLDIDLSRSIFKHAKELSHTAFILQAKGFETYSQDDLKPQAKGFETYSQDDLKPQAEGFEIYSQDDLKPQVKELFMLTFDQELSGLQYFNDKFFRVKAKSNLSPHKVKPKKASSQLMKQIEAQQYPIKLDGHSARSVIIALARLLSQNKCFSSKLIFQIGDTKIEISPEVQSNHQVGNALLSIINPLYSNGKEMGFATKYGDGERTIQRRLTALTRNEPAREKKLAELLQVRSNRISSFDTKDFALVNNKTVIRLDGEASVFNPDNVWPQYSIYFLNLLNLLRSVFEVARKLYRNEKGGLYDYPNDFAQRNESMPVGCAQAQTSKLLRKNLIHLHDAYGNSKVADPLMLRISKESIEYRYDPESDRAIYGAVTGATGKKSKCVDWEAYKAEKVALIEKKVQLISDKYCATFFPGKDSKLESLRSMPSLMKEEYGSGGESSESDSDYDEDKAIAYKYK